MKIFSFSIQTFPRSPKHVKITKSTIFWATEKFKILWERSWKDVFNGDIFGNVNRNYYHQKPEINLKHGLRPWKFLIMMTYCISLKRSWKVLFNDKIFENVDWNWYYQKPETNPETWYVNEKIFNIDDILHMVEKVLINVI